MENKTDYVKKMDFSTDVLISKVCNPDVGLGKVSNGPFMPMMSGNYQIQMIETQDFQSYSITVRF